MLLSDWVTTCRKKKDPRKAEMLSGGSFYEGICTIRKVGKMLFEKKIPGKFKYRTPRDHIFVFSGLKSD